MTYVMYKLVQIKKGQYVFACHKTFKFWIDSTLKKSPKISTRSLILNPKNAKTPQCSHAREICKVLEIHDSAFSGHTEQLHGPSSNLFQRLLLESCPSIYTLMSIFQQITKYLHLVAIRNDWFTLLFHRGIIDTTQLP